MPRDGLPEDIPTLREPPRIDKVACGAVVENGDKDRWPGIPAVSEGNNGALLELQKFRHFRRYYFELEYDWDRLDFILKKLEAAHPVAIADLERFVAFLRSLKDSSDHYSKGSWKCPATHR
jgi:hypothetical protein